MTTYNYTGARKCHRNSGKCHRYSWGHVLNWKSVSVLGEESEEPGSQLCLHGRQDAGDACTDLGLPVLYKPQGFRGAVQGSHT